jgi:hypothetical protein
MNCRTRLDFKKRNALQISLYRKHTTIKDSYHYVLQAVKSNYAIFKNDGILFIVVWLKQAALPNMG